MNEDWKIALLSRYRGEYQPYDGKGVPLKKSSADIVFDLSSMGEFTLEEVSACMAVNGYEIVFDDDNPYWLLQDNRQPAIDNN
ncbi:MAG: hypothetical protein LBV74_01085 [Tannerella sp.]|jgi:hypothetical protein|nr:hypothetical protein [Tannerella sp.]